MEKQERRVTLSLPEWDAVVNYISAVQTPFNLLELAVTAKQALQNAKVGMYTPNPPKEEVSGGQSPQTEKEA